MVSIDQSAVEEVLTKSRSEIDQKTAIAWASRAISAYSQYATTNNKQWLLDAEEFFHEACEHGSLIENDDECLFLKQIKQMVEPYRAICIRSIKGRYSR